MTICEECKQNVPRRVTFRRADTEKKVCPKCAEDLSQKDFMILCDYIMGKKSK
jgi:transcription initiation factor IIE alpha subunit